MDKAVTAGVVSSSIFFVAHILLVYVYAAATGYMDGLTSPPHDISPCLCFFCSADVLSNRKLLALLLNKRGLKSVTFAEDGQAAIEAVESAGVDFFDIIFMDNTMPVMVSVAAQLRVFSLTFVLGRNLRTALFCFWLFIR